jgi:tetratricopeptide (TPR) repeat protein
VISILLALALLPADHTPKPHLVAGKLAYTQGNYDKAIHEFRKSIREHPTLGEIYMWLGRSLGRKAENSNPLHAALMVGDIRQAFEKAVELDPKNLDARGDLLDFYLEAPGPFGGGVDKARAEADAIAKIYAADGFQVRSKIYEKEEKFVHAEQDLKSAIELEPKPGRYRELAQFYGRRKNYKEMEAAYRKSGDQKSQYYLAAALYEQGQRSAEAEALVRKFLAGPAPEPGDDPTLAQARLLLGQLIARQGRREEAKREFHAALEEYPGMKAAKRELERIQ